ncbi:MAG: HHA domain-containing protein [Planctomycetota bacterium]|jgi:hypothetical protein
MSSYEEMFDSALREEPLRLSPSGQARRAAMREALTAKVINRRRTRRAIRASGALGLAAALVWIFLPTANPEIPPSESAPGYRNLAIQVIQDDPGLMTRFTVKSNALPSGTMINDAELIDLLEAADHPSGILRSGGRLFLTEPLLTDEPPD